LTGFTLDNPDNRRVAVVTGANRGIGRAVARELAVQRMLVILTGRNDLSISAAAHELRAELDYPHIHDHLLDVASGRSVTEFRDWLHSDVGRVDVLVNNAAILSDYGINGRDLDIEVLTGTMEVNLYGALRLSQAVIPMMESRDYGRIVNVSSGWGSITRMAGGPPMAYKLSKVALNGMTRALSDEVSGNIKINAVDPGWVRTRMARSGAPRSPEEGARGIVWAATLPDDGPTGGFFHECEPADW
jgi:NAD(P)-dependent dehydrogenase (short-subunit alcohol dehydrogenase family)